MAFVSALPGSFSSSFTRKHNDTSTSPVSVSMHCSINMVATAPKNTINVAVLGATGSVGQRFMRLLDGHPWFKVSALGASPRSAGKRYADACNWKQAVPIPQSMSDIVVSECNSNQLAYEGVQVVFSGLDATYAGPIEESFANKGCAVFSNARNHRMDDDVPILIPPVNIEHLDVIPVQRKARGWNKGFIVTNANCSTTAMAIALKPIQARWGINTIMVTTMQAISGAGYPGLSSMDMLDNIVPLIGGEEEKMETESKKIFASFRDGVFQPASFNVSAMCNRVHVLDGHTECVSLKLDSPASPTDIIAAIKSYPSVTKDLGLPSAPDHDVVYNSSPDRPQPRLDRGVGNGYTVTVGRVRECNIFDTRLVLFGHNTVVGAAGGSILNAELCVAKGLVG